MSVTALDTHKVVKTLQAVGFSEEQAEAVTQVVSDSQHLDLSHLATKADLAHVATKADLAQFAAKADLAQFATKADLERFATKADLERFATKADLERFATKADLAELRTEIAEAKSEIIKWVFGISFAQAGLMVALLRFMH